ncbi:RNA-binding protein Pasilla isoform X8 [Anopheles aquasalis]|uniref:RNA-binding protein Pasilla isoform X8 n=1 Tax=Anopheles aquasalis TaxID=42839 RepID=UPI00215AB3BC|nr:RNA-binding protein Pasilla isoform X8 [Anopheles aquasalis]
MLSSSSSSNSSNSSSNSSSTGQQHDPAGNASPVEMAATTTQQQQQEQEHQHHDNSYFTFDDLSSALADEDRRNNGIGVSGCDDASNNGGTHHHHHHQHHQHHLLHQEQQSDPQLHVVHHNQPHHHHHHQQHSQLNGSSSTSSGSSTSSSLLSNGADSLMARLTQLNRPPNGEITSGVATPHHRPLQHAVMVSTSAHVQHKVRFEQQHQQQSDSFAQSTHQQQQQQQLQQSVSFSQQRPQQQHHQHLHMQQMQRLQAAAATQQKSGFGKSSFDAHTDPTAVSQLKHAMDLFEATGATTAATTTATNGGGDNYHFKTLVPSVAAGAIIGKGGETIASLQKDAGARVKMSKSHDFYPGTTERVCLISGTVDGILTVLDFIIDKIREKPDMTKALTEADAKQAQERDKQVKILVPNSTAGMIIGKAGAYIKQIKEESGSYVQISQKPKDLTLQERCITIIGEKENNKVACKMILAKIVEDPSSGTCLNVSYADINGPVANFNPTGSPFAASQTPNFSSSTASLNSAISGPLPSATAAGLLVNGTGLNLSLNLGAPSPQTNPTVTTQLLDHIKGAMRQSGYSETATAEMHAALGVLAKYGVLGIGVGLQNGTHTTPTLSYLGMPEMQQSSAAAAAASAASGVYGAVGQLSLESYLHGAAGTATPRTTTIDRYDPTTFDPFRHPGTQAATPISINNNAFGLSNQTALNAAAQSLGSLSKSPTPAEMTTSKEKNVEIPEVIVGAILGPAGRSLVEIQHISGANIQISKKGIFAPGTRNRIVTITGQPNAINVAQYLIEERITQEETKRACQTAAAANAAAANKTSAASVAAAVTQ